MGFYYDGDPVLSSPSPERQRELDALYMDSKAMSQAEYDKWWAARHPEGRIRRSLKALAGLFRRRAR